MYKESLSSTGGALWLIPGFCLPCSVVMPESGSRELELGISFSQSSSRAEPGERRPSRWVDGHEAVAGRHSLRRRGRLAAAVRNSLQRSPHARDWRVCAAFFAAARRPARPLVAAAFFAAAERAPGSSLALPHAPAARERGGSPRALVPALAPRVSRDFDSRDD